MNTTLPDMPAINGRLSFAPLLATWRKKADEAPPSVRKLYDDMLGRIEQHPELWQPIENDTVLEEQKEWIDLLMSSLFPITMSDVKDIYAVSVPFNFKFVYTSERFRNYFLDDQGQLKYQAELAATRHLIDEKCATAYKLILSKFYGLDIPGNLHSVMHFKHPVTGLTNYFEMELDPTFIDVVATDELPDMDPTIQCRNISDLNNLDQLNRWMPLEKFRFDGLSIIRIRDVTHREVINNIKNILLEQHTLEDSKIFNQLENEMQSLIGIPGLKLGITPFLNINDHFVYSEQYAQHSILLKSLHGKSVKEELSRVFRELFSKRDAPVLMGEITNEVIEQYPMLAMLPEKGYHSATFFPLKSKGKLLGVMSAVHPDPKVLCPQHLEAVMPSIPLFVLALEKASESLDIEVDKVIKKHFTAVQSSVEWKFTEAALQYLVNKKQGIKAKIDPIFFDHVFPLYGAIDIRNSTIERNSAIQRDLLEQLKSASDIIKQAQAVTTMPLLKEVSYRVDKFQYNVSNILFSGDEILIDNFLKTELVELFEHLRIMVPNLQPAIDSYFAKIDSRIKLRVENRHHFEESIALINQELARFIDQEQEAAQRIYPHYFERFVTDGIDFNMYIGQSISPDKPFDTFYLKNLKMWQLSTLANAAVMINQLQERLSMPLQTTQLILAHSLPISISFRTAERKFDVEGAYNIRYEIIKKRIDKVHVKNSNERLTQPGKLAIVYTQSKEATEYMDYIEFLQNQNVLLHDLEELELEELQGVVGLRALRVGINMENKLPSSELESEREAREPSILG